MWLSNLKLFFLKNLNIKAEDKYEKILNLGFDRCENQKPLAANGRAMFSNLVCEELAKTYNLSDHDKELPYGYSWALSTLEFLGYTLNRNSVALLRSRAESWLYPVAPIGAFQHWLFSDNDNTLLRHCSKESMESIRKNKAFLLIDYSYEGNGSQLKLEPIFKQLHFILNIHKIPNNKVIFLFGNLLSEVEYYKWCKKNKINNKINWIAVNFFQTALFRNFKSNPEKFLSQKQFEHKNIHDRKHTFLCFNRQPHAHRIALGLLLFKNNLLQNSLYSFPSADYLRFDWKDCLKNIFSKDWSERVLEVKNNFSETLPRRIDVNDDYINPAFTDTDVSLYLNTKFSIISETTFEGHNIFFSEKIYKPIVNFHPFILVGHSNSLLYLKQLGYKTFHPWFDESYDQIINPEDRLDAITNEVARLSKLSEEEWAHIWEKIEPIIKHNRSHFEKNGDSLLQIADRIIKKLK